jgi:hypothetical protein
LPYPTPKNPSWIRDPGGIVWWKNRRSKISWHCPFKLRHSLCTFLSYSKYTAPKFSLATECANYLQLLSIRDFLSCACLILQ